MGKGTEAFPDLGEHCNHEECNQLDFLPFTCDGCHKVFWLEHRANITHSCPKSEHNSRMVVVCEICSMSIVKEAEQDRDILVRHDKSGDRDPTKKQKPKCPVRGCKQLLTFSNTSTCKNCSLKVWLKHRFPSDHACKAPVPIMKSSMHHPTSLWNKKGNRLQRHKAKDADCYSTYQSLLTTNCSMLIILISSFFLRYACFPLFFNMWNAVQLKDECVCKQSILHIFYFDSEMQIQEQLSENINPLDLIFLVN